MDDMTLNRPKAGWKRLWLKHQFSLMCYFALIVAVLLVYHTLSDGDFSFLMTLGSLLVLFGFALLVAKVAATRKASNISLKTLQAYALVFAARLCSILFYEGYLPFDKSGDWFYQAVEIGALVLALGLIVALLTTHRRTYSAASDRFGGGVLGLPDAAGVLVLAAPAALLAALLHPNLNNNWFTDVAWTFALYLEAVAVYPQLYMFYDAARASRGGVTPEVEPFELNFVFSIAVARLLHFIFWLSSYQELNDRTSADFGRKFPGHLVVLSQIVNLLLLADFVYYHISFARHGQSFILPHSV